MNRVFPNHLSPSVRRSRIARAIFDIIPFKLGITAFVCLFISTLASWSMGANFTVTNTNDSGPGSLRQAIADADVNHQTDTIVFDPSVFTTPQTITLTTGEMMVLADINSTQGDFYDLSIVGPGPELLTIDGNNQSRMFHAQGGNYTLFISGLTLKHGFATMGGAIYAAGNFLNISNAVVTENNVAGEEILGNVGYSGFGGGILAQGGISIARSLISNNVASGVVRLNTNPSVGDFGTQGMGGGVYSASTATIVRCTFVNNIAHGITSPPPGIGRIGAGGGGGFGGAIYAEFSVTSINSTFTNNSAIAGDGAATTDGVFTGNGGDALGGAIFASGPRILNSTFTGNTAVSGNGGVSTNPTASGIGGNARGGGIYDSFGGPTMANVTMAQNSATAGNGRMGGNGQGGALFVGDSQWNMVNLTVTDNSAIGGSGTQSNGTGQGGGIFSNFHDTPPVPNFRNNIVANNVAGAGTDLFGFFPGNSNNLIRIGDGSTGISNGVSGNLVGSLGSPIDPMLGPLADNGGVTQTRALVTGSPAIDVGTNSVLNPISSTPSSQQPLLIDQRNFPRIAPIGGTIDIGAFEFGTSPTLAPTSSPDLRPESDSGFNNTDNITKATTALFDSSNTIPGATVELLRNGVVVQSITAVTFSSRLIDSIPPLDGVVQYTARQSIGGITSDISPSLTVIFDNTPPTVALNQAATQQDPTRSLPINFTEVFSERVTGSGTVSLQGSTANVTNAFFNSTSPDGITWNCAVSGITSNGAFVIANLNASSYQDPAGNVGSASTSSDNMITVDNVRPSVTINQAPGQPDPTSSQPINFAIAFSEAVTGFTSSDILFSGSTANISQAAINITGGPALYNVAISNVRSSGLVRLSIPANAAQDGLGNLSFASTTIDNTITLNILRTRADFDGDGKTDLSVFRPGDGNWYVLKSNGGFLFQNWGIAEDVLTPDDYDNDGKADLAVFRPSTGNWFVFRSLDSTVGIVNWGTNGDIPVAGDYDNDGKTDVAVFRPSTGQWFVTRSSDSQIDIFSWGVATDIAVPGDYDGDGRTDKAIFRPSTGQWFVFRSSDSQVQVVNWGVSTDRLVPGDYDGDNHDDMAVFRPSTGDWFILRSSDSQVQVVNWGIASDIVAPGDFDGDGRDEPAVFRPSNGNWYANQSTGGFMIANWGTNGDRPIPAAYVP